MLVRRGHGEQRAAAGCRARSRAAARPALPQHAHGDRRPLVDQRGEALHGWPSRSRSKVRGSSPNDHAVSPERSTPAAARDTACRTVGASRSRSASRSLPSAEHGAGLVLDPERHPQVVGHAVEVPGLARDGDAGASGAARGPARRRAARSPARCRCRTRTARAVSGAGTKLRRSVLGQRAISAVTSSCAQAGHLPVEPVGAHPVEHRERDVHGDAVGVALPGSNW